MARITNLSSLQGRRSPEDEARLEQAIERFCSVARAADQHAFLAVQAARAACREPSQPYHPRQPMARAQAQKQQGRDQRKREK